MLLLRLHLGLRWTEGLAIAFMIKPIDPPSTLWPTLVKTRGRLLPNALILEKPTASLGDSVLPESVRYYDFSKKSDAAARGAAVLTGKDRPTKRPNSRCYASMRWSWELGLPTGWRLRIRASSASRWRRHR